jgi:hypothetical protein
VSFAGLGEKRFAEADLELAGILDTITLVRMWHT